MRRTVGLRLGRTHHRQLRKVCPAHRDEAERAEPQGECAVDPRPPVRVAQHPHALVMRLAHLLSAEVLEEKRHAREGAVRDGTRRVSECARELAMDHGVDLGIEPLDSGDRRLDELASARPPRGERALPSRSRRARPGAAPRCSVRYPSAVDDDRLTGDERGVVGQEVAERAEQIVGPHQATERSAADVVLAEHLRARRRRASGGDAVDPDVARCPSRSRAPESTRSRRPSSRRSARSRASP